MSNNANVLLRMEGITKEFPGVKALDGVNLTVKAGTGHCYIVPSSFQPPHGSPLLSHRLLSPQRPAPVIPKPGEEASGG